MRAKAAQPHDAPPQNRDDAEQLDVASKGGDECDAAIVQVEASVQIDGAARWIIGRMGGLPKRRAVAIQPAVNPRQAKLIRPHPGSLGSIPSLLHPCPQTWPLYSHAKVFSSSLAHMMSSPTRGSLRPSTAN